ncbi:MAG: class I fructose-bisphosphate aldolase [Verrucomicrobiales bacterium]
MSIETKEDHLKNFFRSDGRAMILPIDHGTAIPVPGLEDPRALIEGLNESVDGYVVNMGVANAFGDALEGKGLCFRTDVYKPAAAGNPDRGSYMVYTAEDALEAGANAVMNMLYVNHAEEDRIIAECAGLISQSMTLEMPVILEALPFGIGRADDYTLENIRFTVRMAAELGADVVKTAFPTGASADEFRSIIEETYVPVVVLGGAAMGDDAALLKMVGDAMDAGAAGVAIGRNVWQHPDPREIAKRISGIVHA